GPGVLGVPPGPEAVVIGEPLADVSALPGDGPRGPVVGPVGGRTDPGAAGGRPTGTDRGPRPAGDSPARAGRHTGPAGDGPAAAGAVELRAARGRDLRAADVPPTAHAAARRPAGGGPLVDDRRTALGRNRAALGPGRLPRAAAGAGPGTASGLELRRPAAVGA